MIAKILGGAVIILSSLAAASVIISFERKKLLLLDSFIALIRYIRNQIDCYSMPIDRILTQCPPEILSNLGGRESGMSFGDILSQDTVVICDEARQILSDFSGTLGKNYRERQVRLCDSAISSLESLREREGREFHARSKAVRALCLAIGGLAVMLLI